MNSSIELIRQQLDALQSNPNVLTQQVNPVSISSEDIRRIVKEELATELEQLKSSLQPQKPVQTPVTPQQTTKVTLLQAIGAALTEEEQLWLSSSDKLQGIEAALPEFFISEDGKLAIQSFIIYYRGLYEN
jgi:hypothetical protein